MKVIKIYTSSKTVEVKPLDSGFQVIVTTNPNATFIISDYKAPMWIVDGNPGSPEIGENTFQTNSLIGAEEINFIFVNKVVEFIGEDYLFNTITGTITRNNTFQVGDKMVTPYKKS